MRKWMLIGLLFLPLLACEREWEPEVVAEEEDPQGEVTVVFSVPADQMPTKALGENPGLETMHLAIFGSSGYLKQYVPATLLEAAAPRDSLDGAISMPSYTFSATLAMSNSPRKIHFIGNGPASIDFGRDYDVLPQLLCAEGKTGFWQMREVPGIYALQDDNENYLTPDKENGGYKIRDKNASIEDQPYVVSEATAAYFRNIPLIRNWAKILIKAEDGSHFTPYSFAVVNSPAQGALVPYGGIKGFILNYKDLDFDTLTGDQYKYLGNLPSNVAFDSEPPSEEEFKNPDGHRVVAHAASDNPNTAPAVYLYERPVPDGELAPSCVIVYGHYRNEEDPVDEEDTEHDPKWRTTEGDYYYKVDLMNNGEYYPILRNFKYEIQIHRIAAPGQLTPEAAFKGAGSADVSADINASHLPDISDGIRRMAIQPWMAKTFIRPTSVQLFVKFLDDITEGNTPNTNPASVTYELIPADAGIIKDGLVTIGEARTGAANTEDNGWRPVTFDVVGHEEAIGRTQTLRIKCKTNPDNANEVPLYRDIVISVLPTQEMRVKCASSRVLRVSGEKVRVDVSLPDGLMQSMFPLEFYIEAKDRTLTTDNSISGNNMPVISRTSIIDETKPSFCYQRTVTWDEYKELVPRLDFDDDSRWRTFSSYFKTNCDDSATDVYVANEFFHTRFDSFDNYQSFRNPKFTTAIPCRTGATITMTAQMMRKQDNYEKIYLDLKNLEPASGSGIQTDDEGRYYYQPTTQNLTFNLITTTDDGDISVTLTADNSYEPALLEPYNFKSAGLMDFPRPQNSTSTTYSEVAFGHAINSASKQLCFGYYDDLDALNAKVNVKTRTGLGTGTQEWTPTGPVTETGVLNYHEKWMNTLTTNAPLSCTFSAVGYVEKTDIIPRFTGEIITINKTMSAGLQSWTEKNKSSIDFKVDFHESLAYDSTRKGLVLEKGHTYTLDVEAKPRNSGDTECLYFVGIFYAPNGAHPYIPAEADPADEESVYYCYPGNNFEYGWRFPYGVTSGQITLKAPKNQDAVITRIYVKAFRGTLLDVNGNPETP